MTTFRFCGVALIIATARAIAAFWSTGDFGLVRLFLLWVFGGDHEQRRALLTVKKAGETSST